MIGIFFVNRRLFLSFRILSNQPRNLNVKWWRCDRNVAISTYLLKQAWIESLVSTFLNFCRKKVHNLTALHTPPPYLSNTKISQWQWMLDGWQEVQPHKGTAWGPLLPNVIYFFTTHPRPHKSIFSSEMGKCDKKVSPDKQCLTCRPLMRIWTPLLIRWLEEDLGLIKVMH